MSKESISAKQSIAIIIMFIIGNSVIMVEGLEAKKDLWLAIILSILLALPIALINARIHHIFPEKDLYQVFEICFGKFIGNGMIILYTWFIFHTEVLIFRNYSSFVITVGLFKTPIIIPIIAMGILCSMIIRSGIETLGRVAQFFIIIVIGFVFISILSLIPNMHINHIRPVFYEGIKPIIKGTFSTLSFPFSQLFIFTIVFQYVQTQSYYKVYTFGLFIGGTVIFFTSGAIILTLGVNDALTTYFPAYSAFSRLSIKNFIQNLEIVISVLLPMATFIKASVYLLAICKGIMRIFKFMHYRFILTPVTLLIINTAYLIHDSIIDLFEWMADIWPYYTAPFQMIFPFILLIVAEIKKKKILSNTSL